MYFLNLTAGVFALMIAGIALVAWYRGEQINPILTAAGWIVAAIYYFQNAEYDK